MARPIPVQDRIEFATACLDAERILLTTWRPDSFDGMRERARIWARIDRHLDALFLMLLERDGITIPDAAGGLSADDRTTDN